MAVEGESLIFGDPRILEFAPRITDILIDGTFYTCPQLWYPAWNIFFQANDHVFPLFTVLAPQKDTATYDAILRRIRELLPDFKPARCNFDYKDAERLAMEEVFPETKLFGCWFHF